MTIVKSYEADRFVTSLPSSVKAILCYGVDKGLAYERARMAAQAFLGKRVTDPFALVKVSADDMTADGAIIAGELCSLSLFGEKRCIWLRPESCDITKILTKFSDKIADDTLLIVEAGALKPTSALRKLFEQHNNWKAIACYTDSRRDLENLLDCMLAKVNLKIDRDARSLLLEHIGGDRLASRMEIEKICLYASGKSAIQLNDILAVSGDVSAVEISDMIDSVGLGDLLAFDQSIHRILGAKTSHAKIIAMSIQHFCLLHELRCEIDAGENANSVVENRKPPIFFKRRNAIIRQCSNWTRRQLDHALNKLHEGECLSRTGDLIAQNAVMKVLMDITIKAQRRTTIKNR